MCWSPDWHVRSCEVFGHLLADRVLEGSHVCSVQRLCVRCDVALLGVTRARVHVRVNRVDHVDHVQESLLRDPVRRGVGHELAREHWPVRVYSVALLLTDDLCPHAVCHVRSERDRDENARGEDMG